MAGTARTPGLVVRDLLLAPVMALAFATIAPPTATADDFDCSNPEAQQEMNYCSAQEFWRLDGELTKLYERALADKKKADQEMPPPEGPDLKTEAQALEIAEKAWLQYRDAHCDGMGYKARGGTLEALLVGNCKIEITKNRMKELEDLMTGLGN